MPGYDFEKPFDILQVAARAIDNLKRYCRSGAAWRPDGPSRHHANPSVRKVDPLNLAQPEFVRRRRWKRLLRIRARRNPDAGVRDNFRVANRELTAPPATTCGGWAKFYALASAVTPGAQPSYL
jgi:hypothetical protein